MEKSYTVQVGLSSSRIRDKVDNLLVSELMIGLAYFLLLFENALQTQISDIFSYLDEIICLLFFFAASIKQLSSFKRGTLTVYEKRMLILVVVLCCIGLSGNLLYGVQSSISAIVIDLFTCSKFVLAYVSFNIVFANSNCKSVASLCVAISKLFIVVAFVCMLTNQFVGIGMSWEQRFGIEAFVFLFGHPSNFAAAVVGAFALFLVDPKKNRFSLVCCVFLLISTLRFKAIAFVAVIFLAIFAFRKLSRITFGFVFLASVVAFVAASYQLDIYLNGDTARGFLLASSFEVANGAFPFGSGFGTYGSDVTKDAYPSLYTALGFQNVYGLTSSNPIYLADMFYSTIIAQCGWIGIVLFCIILLLLFIDVTKVSRANGVYFWAAISIPIYLIIASTSESSFFSSYSVYLALCLVAILRNSRNGVLVLAEKGTRQQ